jgi:hypothetical protein
MNITHRLSAQASAPNSAYQSARKRLKSAPSFGGLAQQPTRLRGSPATATPHSPVLEQVDARPKALMRRYNTLWLSASGDIEDSTRIAPATPLFEEAFSALARGSVLQTEEGRIAIEDIVPGMRVLTAEGEAVRVMWIGSMMVYSGAVAEGLDPVKLTRFTADAMGHGRPMQDVILGPRARLLLRDQRCAAFTQSATAYVPARSYLDGVSVIEVTPAAPICVFHLALERHGTLRVGGLEVESYHPGTGLEAMMEPRMLSLFKDLFPHVSGLEGFGEAAHQRLTKFEVDQLIG